nr:MAG: hypothetical protein [Bacteriophage sp.]
MQEENKAHGRTIREIIYPLAVALNGIYGMAA